MKSNRPKKHLFATGVLAAVFTAFATVMHGQTCAPVHDGLVSWWRAENNATDNWDSNNGIPYIRMKYSVGKVGHAFGLDYFSTVTVPDSPSLRITNALTIEAWVNPSSQVVTGSYPRTIVSKFGDPGSVTTRQSSFYLGFTTNRLLYFAVSANGSAQTITSITSTQPLPTNLWSHIAAVYDGAALRIFINGTTDVRTNYSAGIFPGEANLGIGTIALGVRSVWPMLGILDELSIYNRALTEGEIQAIFNADIAGKCLVSPSIVTQPQDQAVPLGEDVKFSVSVFGSRPLAYQWRFNGTNLSNATNSALVLEKVQTNRVGNYSVFVSNAVGTATSSNAALALLPPPVCTDTPAGLISWWPGDGNSSDAMGTNNLTQFSASYVTGKVDRAFNFNGDGGFASAPNSASVNFGNDEDFTIEAWIKPRMPTTIATNLVIVEKRQAFGVTGIGYSFTVNQGRLACWLGTPTGNSQSLTNTSQFISNGPDLRDGIFHHVAVTLNRTTTNSGRLYVDGHEVLAFDPARRHASLANTSPLVFGQLFPGPIDELAIYNRALNAGEILAIHQAGAAGKCKVKPSILVQPASQRVTVGSNVTFSATAAGTPSLRYQWFRNGVTLGSAATNPIYSFIVQPGVAGTYSVRVTNLFGSITSSNAVLTVNYVPVADDGNVTLNEDTSTNIMLRAFDHNPEPLAFVFVTPPQHGALGLLVPIPADAASFARISYTPAQNYNGPDSFTFKVNDGFVDSAPATVSLTILPVNDAPVAQPQSVLLDEEDGAAITLSASDVEGDVLNYTLLNQPMHGTLAGTVPNLIYQPLTNYNGPDSFTFKASDTVTDSLPATVSITVRPVNDPPLAVARVFTLFLVSSNDTELKVIAACNNRARVIFDASLSRDVDEDTLSFAWWEQGRTNAFGNTVVTTNLLRVGSHDIALHVNDGTVTVTNTFPLWIISASHAIRLLEDQVVASALSPRVRRPLVAILEGAAKAFDHGHEKPGVHHLKLFQDKTRKSLTSANEALATQWTWIAQQIIDVFETCNEQSAGVCRMEDRGHGRRCLCFDGVPGRPHIIEASTDLVHWQTIGVAVECAPGRFEFEDFAAGKMSRRFYRLQSQ